MAPVVPLPRQGLSKPLLIGLAALAALALFLLLEARRHAVEDAPGPAFEAAPLAPPPPLYVPARGPAEAEEVAPAPRPAPVAAPQMQAPAPAPYREPQIVYMPQPAEPATMPLPPQRVAAEPALVIDNTGSAAAEAGAAAGADPADAAAGRAAVLGTRARAGMLANRATTVPQGSLIPAVMETAFDSTRPGLARAIVSSDVRGFDGTQVLIPRGSRLIGEYRSDVALGQRRALVHWARLVLPDGVTIAIGSPASDPLGAGGIPARVNSHFLQRFASALLTSTIDIGTALAARGAGSPVILALPGSLHGVGTAPAPSQVTPTLTVRAGTSISVFVSRDLDFSSVERQR